MNRHTSAFHCWWLPYDLNTDWTVSHCCMGNNSEHSRSHSPTTKSLLPLGIRDPAHLTQCVTGHHKCTCQMASESVKGFKQSARMWQMTDRQTDHATEKRVDRRDRLHYNSIKTVVHWWKHKNRHLQAKQLADNFYSMETINCIMTAPRTNWYVLWPRQV